MKKKFLQVSKFVIFWVIFCLLFYKLTILFSQKTSNNVSILFSDSEFYSLTNNAIDVLFIGSSAFYRGISPLTIWEDQGITSYVRSHSLQSPIASYYFLAEALKYQKPKVVVVEISPIYFDYDVDKYETFLRRSIDPMKLSVEKLLLISNIVNRSEKQTYFSYLFPLLRYHSRWNEIGEEDFSNYKFVEDYGEKGFVINFKITDFKLPYDFMSPTETAQDFNETSKYYYEEMIHLCKEKGIPIIFVTMPRDNWDYSKHLGVQQLSDKFDLVYIDYCLPEYFEEIQLNLSSDFRDRHHLNTLGAQKLSQYIGEYLQKTFGLSDKRNNPDYQQWNIDLQYFNKRLSEVMNTEKK